MNRNRSAVLWILLGFGTMLVGCGKGGGAVRLPVIGSVSLSSGEKLSGSITFVPAEGRSGPAATTMLVDGNYHFDRGNGPTAGPHRVIVKRVISKRTIFESLGVKKPKTSNMAPAGEPKMEWTLSVDVAESGARYDLILDP